MKNESRVTLAQIKQTKMLTFWQYKRKEKSHIYCEIKEVGFLGYI